MDVQNRNDLNSINKFPGDCVWQVHPETKITELVRLANASFEILSKLSWITTNGSSQSAPPPPLFVKTPYGTKPNTEKLNTNYDEHLSKIAYDFFQKCLNSERVLPPESNGYFAALIFLENDCLNRNLRDLNGSQFLELIKKINSFVIELPIGYRTKNLYVFNPLLMPEEKTAKSFKVIDKYILDKFPSQKKTWEVARKKLWQYAFVSNEKQINDPLFTEEEKKLVDDIMRITPDSKQIPFLMEQFVNELVKKINSEEKIEAIMSFAHQKIIEIHPYFDGNGRTARLLMYLLGMWVGKKPMIIDNANEYNEVARTLDVEKFKIYLKDLEAKQSSCNPFMEKCMRSFFDDSLIQMKIIDTYNFIKQLKNN